ncbi:transposase [Aeromonas sobria]|nr:transposase [Aeromonas sobria]
MIDGVEAAYLLADRGYDTNALMEAARAKGMESVIPSKRNRKEQLERELFKARHLVENAFLHLKQWRGIATKYAKTRARLWQRCRSAAHTCGPRSYDDNP